MTSLSPAARDVINADKVRSAIVRRSRGREDHPEVSRWLQTHFFRWAINRFAHVLSVQSVARWRTCIGTGQPPEWFVGKLAAGNTAMIYIDPEHHLLREHELRMVEFFHARLASRLAGKFHRITFDAADAAWRKDHERMQRRRTLGWWPSQPHALTEVVTTPHGRFVELKATGNTLRAEMAYESFHMQHCLGQFADHATLEGGYGELYARNCEQGRTRLFSLRDNNNRPHVTVSLTEDLGEWSLEQIKGKQNATAQAKYAQDVLCLLNTLRPRDAGSTDMMRLGIVARHGADEISYVAFGDLQQPVRQHALLAAFPHLLNLHPRPDPFAQWLALGAGAAIVDEVTSPHGPVLAALLTMNTDEAGAQARMRLSDALSNTFPQWLAPVTDDVGTSRSGWLRRLLARSRPATTHHTQRHRRWALALAELLFYRLGMDGDTGRLQLAAPPTVPARVRAQIEAELAIEDSGAETAIERFCARFFRVPYFEHPQLVDVRDDGQEDAARNLLAWHAMRQSYVLRLLVAWGLLDESRGWPLLLLNAQRVQDCFNDWLDFGSAAARGHATWLQWNDPQVRHAKATEVAFRDFHDEFGCVWKRLHWSDFNLAQAVAPLAMRANG